MSLKYNISNHILIHRKIKNTFLPLCLSRQGFKKLHSKQGFSWFSVQFFISVHRNGNFLKRKLQKISFSVKKVTIIVAES